MKYVSLHHHSTFSFLDGYALPETHVRRAAELEMAALALTEHGNISSHVQLERAANAEGIKPIFGCELYTGPIESDRRRQRKNHLTVLAQTEQGYKNLLRLVSRGWAEGFYYEPTVSGALLAEHSEGLVVLSGCQGSLLATSLVGGKNVAPEDASYERCKKVARRFHSSLGDSFYLEVQAFPELAAACEINQAYERLSKELNIPLVATGDVHYTRPNENEMQQILHNVRGGNKQTLEDQARNWGYDVPLSPPASDKVMYRRLRATGMSHKAAQQAIANSAEIAERCTVVLPKMEQLRYPGEEPGPVLWRKWINDGWYYRGINRKPNIQEYRARLRYEMEIIEGKDFIDYFLVVSDLVKFAKDKGIPVGPARGSAAASLVCYLLRITEVDPLLFPNLVFERFIDTTREDLPDVDLDFDDDRRGEIWDYAASKYGRESVGSIGTFTKYKSKNSLDDVARVYRIPAYEIDTVKELLIERTSGDLRASATIEDTVENFEAAKAVFEKYPELRKAMDIEGNYRGMGIHAAGLVISSGKLNDACAVYTRESNGEKVEVISADKYDSEYLNILKIDALGLSTMGFLRLALEMIGMTLEELYALPLDDPETIRGFQENDVISIFQFDGRAMRTINGALRPDNFDEIADVCALARPGPLHNGASAEYIDVKQGKKEPKRFHPLLDDITKNTNYQIVYQEQILRIVMEIGGFDWTHAAYIRKIISKKLGEQEFNRQWERFWAGAQQRGVDEESARSIWNSCITAGSYAFNNAHTVSYGMIAYWCMWIKRHHPQAFYVAALTKFGEKRKNMMSRSRSSERGEKKSLEILQDAVKHGMVVLPPDPAHSDVDWKPWGDNGLLAGFRQIHGIGETMAEKFIEYRKDHKVTSWASLTEIKGVGPKTIERITEFVNKEDPFDIHKLHRILEGVRAEIRSGELGKLPIPTHTSLQVPYERGEDTEVVWIGKIIHRNLRDLFEVHFSRTGETLDPETVSQPELNEWVVMLGQDEEDIITIACVRWLYPKFRQGIWKIRLDEDVVLVKGVKRGFQSRRAIYITDFWVIQP